MRKLKGTQTEAVEDRRRGSAVDAFWFHHEIYYTLYLHIHIHCIYMYLCIASKPKSISGRRYPFALCIVHIRYSAVQNVIGMPKRSS